MTDARSSWWSALTKRGDPLRIGNLAFDAFEAGWEARGGGDMGEVIDRQRVTHQNRFNAKLEKMAKREPTYQPGDVRHDGCIETDRQYRGPIGCGQVYIRRSKQADAERHGWQVIQDSNVDGDPLIIVQK